MTDPPQPAKTPEPPYYAAIFTSLRTERDGEIVGFGQIFPSDVVEMLHCDPAHARRGTGGRLLAALEERARSQGQVVLDAKSSLRACSFFRRHGYREMGREVVTRGRCRNSASGHAQDAPESSARVLLIQQQPPNNL